MSTEGAVSPTTRFPKFNDAWRNELLGAVSKTVTSGSRDWAQYYATSGDKFIRMTNLPRGGVNLLLDDLRFVKLPKDSSEGKRTSLVANDILISITAELGKIGLIPTDFGTAYINQHTALVRLDLEKVDARFIAHKLASKTMNNKINRLNDAGAKSGLNLPTIRSFPIALPALPEQKKIADFLTAVDARIGQLAQKKALLEDYKKGVMQQLFSQAIRFKDDDGSEYPDWEEKVVGDVADIKGGKRIPKGKSLIAEDNGYPYITVSDFNNCSVDLADIRYVPEDVVKTIKNYTISVTDLYISVAGTLGLVGTVPPALDGANLTENANKLTNLRCNREYLLQYLRSEKFNSLIDSVKTTGAQPKLAIYAIKAFHVPLPSLPEQHKIADFLSAIDNKIESVAKQIDETKTFKKGLLQQMFV